MLDDLGSVRTLVGIAAPLGALASAVTGVMTLALAQVLPGSGFFSAIGLWWGGDYLGALVVAPVLLTWRGRPLVRARRDAVELLSYVVGAVLAAAVIFRQPDPTILSGTCPIPIPLVSLRHWGSTGFGPRVCVSPATLTVALLFTIGYTVRGGGPFVMHSIPSTDVSPAALRGCSRHHRVGAQSSRGPAPEGRECSAGSTRASPER